MKHNAFLCDLDMPDDELIAYCEKSVRYWLRSWRFLRNEDLEDVVMESLEGMVSRYCRNYKSGGGMTPRGYALTCLRSSMMDALRKFTRHHKMKFEELDLDKHDVEMGGDEEKIIEERLSGRAYDVAKAIWEGESPKKVRRGLGISEEEWIEILSDIRKGIIG